MLADYMAPALPRRLQTATKAGAQVFVEPLRNEARRVSRRMGAAVKTKQATHDVGEVVFFDQTIAPFAHFVVIGTRDHGPKHAQDMTFTAKDGAYVTTKHVRGVRPNPMVDRVASRFESQAYRALDQSLDRTESK